MSTAQSFLNGRVILHAGDCREVLKTLAENSVDSVVTDPPYHLTSIVKRFGAKNAAPAKPGKDGAFGRASAGFMGKQWDGGDIAFQPELWAEVLRVLKPGGYIMAFSGCRTYHRMACAIEDAGFITHPMFCWATGQGFPKAHSLFNQLRGKICDCERAETISECDLRSLRNADVSAPVPFEEMGEEVLFESLPQPGLQERWKTPRNGNEGRVESGMERRGDVSKTPRKLCEREICSVPAGTPINGEDRWLRNGASLSDGEMVSASIDEDRMRASRGSQPLEQCSNEFGSLAGQPEPQDRRAWPLCEGCGKQIVDADGWFYGTQSLKPSLEPIYFGQKRFSEKTGAANVLRWGTGAINVGACKIPSSLSDIAAAAVPERDNLRMFTGDGKGRSESNYDMSSGRWPANLLHDNSEEVLACFPESGGGAYSAPCARKRNNGLGLGNEDERVGLSNAPDNFGDSGSAARFFKSFPQDDVQRIWYGSKAGQDSRLGSSHPTVKPIALMQYLVKLITPPGGTVLDLFAGTGTTAEAAFREGFRTILIEHESEYIADIERRMSLVMEGPVTRAHAGMKARGRPVDNGPLFAGVAAE